MLECIAPAYKKFSSCHIFTKYNHIETIRDKYTFAGDCDLIHIFKPEVIETNFLTIHYKNNHGFITICCNKFFPNKTRKLQKLNQIIKIADVSYNSILYDILTYLKTRIETEQNEKEKIKLENNLKYFRNACMKHNKKL